MRSVAKFHPFLEVETKKQLKKKNDVKRSMPCPCSRGFQFFAERHSRCFLTHRRRHHTDATATAYVAPARSGRRSEKSRHCGLKARIGSLVAGASQSAKWQSSDGDELERHNEDGSG